MGESNRGRGQQRQDKERAWADALQYALDSAVGEASTDGMSRPLVQVLDVGENGTRIEIELRYQAGKTYCCAESGCALWGTSRVWWSRLREALREVTDREPPPLTVVVHGVVEGGARLKNLEAFRLPMESEAYSYRAEPRCERDAR